MLICIICLIVGGEYVDNNIAIKLIYFLRSIFAWCITVCDVVFYTALFCLGGSHNDHHIDWFPFGECFLRFL